LRAPSRFSGTSHGRLLKDLGIRFARSLQPATITVASSIFAGGLLSGLLAGLDQVVQRDWKE